MPKYIDNYMLFEILYNFFIIILYPISNNNIGGLFND